MNKKLITPIILIALICVGVFVSAGMHRPAHGSYGVEIQLEKGWNIIAGTILEDGLDEESEESEIQFSDIKSMWYYSPMQKKYIEIYPDTDWDSINTDDEDYVLTSAMWIYSEKAGTMMYNTLEDYPDEKQLYKGYNLVTITSEMEGRTLNEIVGTCDVVKSYHWNNKEYAGHTEPNWEEIYPDSEFISELIGLGMVLKVSSDCKLSSLSSVSSSGIPSLPE